MLSLGLVTATLSADANERCPYADEDRRFEVVTEPVEECADDSIVVFAEARHWEQPAAPSVEALLPRAKRIPAAPNSRALAIASPKGRLDASSGRNSR